MKWISATICPFVVLLVFFVALRFANTRPAATSQPADAPCEAPDAWFVDSGTPRVPDDFKVPSDDECNFYKWGWQSFLWLTQADDPDGPPRFTLFHTPNDLFPAADAESHQLIATARVKNKDKKILALSVRTSPATSREVTTTEFAQAGNHGVLVDQNHRATYYGQHINPAFEQFVKGQDKPNLNLKTTSDIKNVDPTAQFPPACLELKSSWRVLTDDEKKHLDDLQKRFFITDALVPTLVQVADAKGKISIHADPTQPREEKVALVGLHVVGTITDHPEFIWASFEHIDNAPVLADQNLSMDKPVSQEQRFTFYRAGTNRKDCNVNAVTSTSTKGHLKLTDPGKQTLDPITDVFREFNSGDDLVSVDKQVDSLNKSVQAKLKGNLVVWKNYQLIGAVWIADPKNSFAEGLVFGDSVLAGEKKLSNTTMESFTQLTKANCFGCHNTQSETENGKTIPDMRIKVSHILRNAYIFGK